MHKDFGLNLENLFKKINFPNKRNFIFLYFQKINKNMLEVEKKSLIIFPYLKTF